MWPCGSLSNLVRYRQPGQQRNACKATSNTLVFLTARRWLREARSLPWSHWKNQLLHRIWNCWPHWYFASYVFSFQGHLDLSTYTFHFSSGSIDETFIACSSLENWISWWIRTLRHMFKDSEENLKHKWDPILVFRRLIEPVYAIVTAIW